MKTRLEPSSKVHRLLLASPVGPLLVEHDGRAVRAIRYWPQGDHPPAGTRVEPTRDDALGWKVAEQLREYFAGTRRDFDLPLDPEGTAFRRRVWDALCTIPFGQTRSYRDIAAQVGAPTGMQAVGQANRHNRIPIVIPCHRVVATTGIGGYAGDAEGGAMVGTKRWLLRHEGVAV
ncbi:MAG TPA: methylated-DNA--[protein]-cysteine S-methyltransferase [Longimicrobiaceae bacterium]|nr:methylated-DNA--[protein]-cysteine S-methyltransferase [Longimicrobiaceae bacterium]